MVSRPFGSPDCQLDNNFLKGIMNIGVRPSIDINHQKSTEVHLFDFDKNIYKKLLKVEVISKIRDEIKFPSLNENITVGLPEANQARLQCVHGLF